MTMPLAHRDDDAVTRTPPIVPGVRDAPITTDDPFVTARVSSLRLAHLVTLAGTLALTAWVILAGAQDGGGEVAPAVAASAIVAAAATTSFLAPRSWLVRDVSVLLLLADVAGVVVLRVAVAAELPASTVLAIVPVLWIAAGYRRGPLLSMPASVAVWAVPLAVTGDLPQDRWEWVESLLPLAALLILCGAAGAGAAVFRRQSAKAQLLVREHRRVLQLQADGALVSESVLKAIDSAIVFYDREHRLLLANEGAHRFAALERIDLQHPVPVDDDLVLDENGRTPVPAHQRVLVAASRGEELPPRVAWVGDPGHQRAFLKFSRRVDRADGSLLGVLVVAHDVTEILQSRRVRDDFLRVASHELRTPMTPLLGHLELLEEALRASGDAGAAASQRLEIIRRNVDRLLDRMSELLTAADAEPHISVRPTDLAALVRRSAASFETRAAEKDIALAVETPPTLVADVDPANLALALGNLLDNAIKFAPPATRVEVSLRRRGDMLCVRIADRGPGVPSVDTARVFERFYRTERAHRDAVPGFGLGLAVALSVVVAHGGRITIDQRAGGGTLATVLLPSSTAEPA